MLHEVPATGDSLHAGISSTWATWVHHHLDHLMKSLCLHHASWFLSSSPSCAAKVELPYSYARVSPLAEGGIKFQLPFCGDPIRHSINQLWLGSGNALPRS